MNILDRITRIADSRYNTYLERWKKGGSGIIGYFCSYVPEEIIHAAGFVPYRMRAVGNDQGKRMDIYYSSLNCSFVRHCFEMVLRREYEFLDGIIFMNGCDNTRRMYDNWRHAKNILFFKPDFLHMFITPHVITTDSLDEYVKEIRKLMETIEDRFNISITDERLKNSIRLYNLKRRILGAIYARRKDSEAPLSGGDIVRIMLAVTAVPVEDAIELLHEVERSIDGRIASRDNAVRTLMVGGCVEEAEYLDMIERNGIYIVADSFCLGNRYTDTEIDESEDPIEAIAERYLNKLSCPRMVHCSDLKWNSLFAMAEQYRVDAIIAVKLKFCQLWGVENIILKSEAVKRGYPILLLEREYNERGEGQLKTRVQAFIEKVRNTKKEVCGT